MPPANSRGVIANTIAPAYKAGRSSLGTSGKNKTDKSINPLSTPFCNAANCGPSPTITNCWLPNCVWSSLANASINTSNPLRAINLPTLITYGRLISYFFNTPKMSSSVICLNIASSTPAHALIIFFSSIPKLTKLSFVRSFMQKTILAPWVTLYSFLFSRQLFFQLSISMPYVNMAYGIPHFLLSKYPTSPSNNPLPQSTASYLSLPASLLIRRYNPHHRGRNKCL